MSLVQNIEKSTATAEKLVILRKYVCKSQKTKHTEPVLQDSLHQIPNKSDHSVVNHDHGSVVKKWSSVNIVSLFHLRNNLVPRKQAFTTLMLRKKDSS